MKPHELAIESSINALLKGAKAALKANPPTIKGLTSNDENQMAIIAAVSIVASVARKLGINDVIIAEAALKEVVKVDIHQVS